MILCDVGVYLSAMVAKSPHHEICRSQLEQILAHPEDLAISELVLAAVVRIGSNPRIFQPCPTTEEVFAFVDALRTSPAVKTISPGPKHWEIFRDLVSATGIRGADTTDAYLAALAIEHRCDWWTTDRGFSRFPGLRWRNLLAGA